MYIKKVLEYDWNYAEYIVTDGINDLLCMCESVPLLSNKKPKIGMPVFQLYAFAYEKIYLTKIIKKCEKSIQKGKNHFDYTLYGKIIDKEKSLLGIDGLTISLEKDFENGMPDDFQNGDIIKFKVDRIDCVLE